VLLLWFPFSKGSLLDLDSRVEMKRT